jgi:hypothetical protein
MDLILIILILLLLFGGGFGYGARSVSGRTPYGRARYALASPDAEAASPGTQYGSTRLRFLEISAPLMAISERARGPGRAFYGEPERRTRYSSLSGVLWTAHWCSLGQHRERIPCRPARPVSGRNGVQFKNT